MSAKKKSQDFVPRHYLRRFCFDQGKQIRILMVATGNYVWEAALKGQCARPYFYHTDPAVEESLSEFEGRAEELFKKIATERWLPADAMTRTDILTVINVMLTRTEMHAEQSWKPVETLELEGFRTYLEANNEHELLKVLPDYQLTASNWPTQCVIRGLKTVILLSDLHLKLLISPQGVHFITSDHPVVLLNQTFANVLRDRSLGGVAMRGVQLFLPLSPDLLLLAFDPACYPVGPPDRAIIQISRKEDVDLINALQILNANQCLYFRDEVDEPWLRNLLFKFRDKRPALRDLVETRKVIENGREEVLIRCRAPTIPVPGIWSFCKTRQQFRPEHFVHRDPEICGLHEEYEQDCDRRGKLLTFSEWLDEREAQDELS
jgi:Protein of unknown function (DUF4238)